MTRTEKFLKNSASTALLQVITMLSGFVIPRVMLDIYGSEINGLISSITQFINYFMLVEAGLSAAVVYSLYKPLAEKDYIKISSIVTAAKNFYNKSGYIFVGLTICLAIIYPFFVTTNELSLVEVGILVLVLGVSGALEFFTLAKYRAILTADQKVYIISLASIIYVIVNTSIIVVLSYLNVNIVLVRAIALLSVFLRSYLLYFFVKKHYTYLNYNEVPDNKALDKRWDALYMQIIGVINSGLPILLATLFTNLKTVSVYVVFNLVIIGINGILGVFMGGVSSTFGDIIARKEYKNLKKAYNEFQLIYYLIIASIHGISFAMIMSFILIYTKGITDVNYNLPWTGFFIVLNSLMYSIKTPQGMLTIAAGLYKESRSRITLQTVIAVVFGTLLGYFYGLNGIIIGMLLANLYRTIDLIFFIPKYIPQISKTTTIYRMLGVIILSFIIYIPMLFLHIEISDFGVWIISSIGMIIYACIVISIYTVFFERNTMKGIIHRFR